VDHPDNPPNHPSLGRAWAMPESPAEPEDPYGFDPRDPASPAIATGSGSGSGAPRDDGAGASGGWDGVAPAVPPTPPVPLEPMTVSDLLDGAWAILKTRPRTVFAVTAMIVVPIQVLVAVLQRGATQHLDINSFFANQSSGRASGVNYGLLGGAYLADFIRWLSYFFLGGALSRLVTAWYRGSDLTAREAVVGALKKGHVYLAAFLLLLIPKAVAATCLIPLAFVIPLFMLTAPAITIEDLGPIAGITRSFNLVRRRYWSVVWIWFLSYVLEFVVENLLALIPVLLSNFVPALHDIDALEPAFSGFATLITAPFIVGVCVLLYLDLRVRTEGLDLELEAAAAFADVS